VHCVNPSEIKDLVTHGWEIFPATVKDCVNPSEIKDLVTLLRVFLGMLLIFVSILQKSRTWLHVDLCDDRVGGGDVSILQKSRTWLHSRGRRSPRSAQEGVNPSEIKDLVTLSTRSQASRSGTCVNPSEIKDLVTPMAEAFTDRLESLCQSFRNQGPGYTEQEADGGDGDRGVNPSEIKDLVTQRGTWRTELGTAVSILQKSRTWLHTRPASWGEGQDLCQSFRNQGPGYTTSTELPPFKQLLCQSFRNQGPGYTQG